MFTIKGLDVRYGKLKVLSGLSMDLDLYRIHGIIGFNGAGKTTLLNAIYGLIDVPEGTFLMNGKILHRKQIAYLEAVNFFYSNITGREYLQLFVKKNPHFKIELWQDIFCLPLDNLIESYSTGMKKKLALLGILALDKEVLILDEPFNGLDIESVYALQLVLEKSVKQGKTILITSHIIETLTKICADISVLENGTILKKYEKDDFGELARSFGEKMDAKYNRLIDSAFFIQSSGK